MIFLENGQDLKNEAFEILTGENGLSKDMIADLFMGTVDNPSENAKLFSSLISSPAIVNRKKKKKMTRVEMNQKLEMLFDKEQGLYLQSPENFLLQGYRDIDSSDDDEEDLMEEFEKILKKEKKIKNSQLKK